jgi:hypothetical protein
LGCKNAAPWEVFYEEKGDFNALFLHNKGWQDRRLCG